MTDATTMIIEALSLGLTSVIEYLSEHVLTCLVPAFFIAGAIAALVRKDAILRYFGPTVEKWKSYGLASISGAVLAVCSCTILPLFTGIYKKGSGLGPAVTFLFAGPGINILAIVYTAGVLGIELGVARAVFAIGGSILIGLVMTMMFREHDKRVAENGPTIAIAPSSRARWVLPTFLGLLVAILVVGASGLDPVLRLVAVSAMIAAVGFIAFKWMTRDEVTDWGYETWDLTKKIFPLLVVGTFLVGVISYFLPPETFQPYLGDDSLSSTLLASLLGTILYMPTLLEVPIIGTTFGYTEGLMGAGPALALLLSGPTVSLPSLAVLYRVIGGRKTIAYFIAVVAYSTTAGLAFGMMV